MRVFAAKIFLMMLAPLLLLGCAHQHVDPTVAHPEVAVVRVGSLAGVTSGSGFLISGDGELVTISRLIAEGEPIIITLSDGRHFPANFVEDDREAGVVILKIAGEGYPFLHLRSDDIEPIMHIRVVGTAGISQGIFDHWENSGQTLSLTARVLPADAGAPVLADDGAVIGIVRQPSGAGGSASLATPIWHVTRMMPAAVKQ
jgi:S1-C subfamily serine protease